MTGSTATPSWRATIGGAALAVAVLGATALPVWAQKVGGTLVMVTQPEPGTISNAFNSATTTGEVATKIYDGLLEYDADSNPLPSLAESWTVSPDGKDITFHLRRGVRFHNGDAMTSADVQFSLLQIIKPFHPRGQGNFGPLQAIDTPDDATVVLHLEHAYPAILKAFSSLDAPIMNKRLYEGSDPRTNELNNRPVGTGPWMFKEWQRGSAIVLEKNPNYWRPGFPRLDRLIFRFIGDPATRAAALESGEVQVATFGAIASTEMRRMEKAGIVYIPTGGYQFLAPMVKLTFNVKKPPLDDKRVRQALAYAVDRAFVVDKIFSGFGTPAIGPIGTPYKPAAFYTDDVLRFDVPDRIAKAEALLDAAGHKRGPDGTRFEISHDVAPFGDEYRRMGEYLRQAFARIGVKLVLRNEDNASFIRRTSATYDFDIASAAWIGLGDPTLGIGPKFVTSNIRQGVPYSNIARYSDPAVDELWSQASIEIDPAKRREIFHTLQRKLVEDSPEIFVFELQQVPTARTEVKALLSGAFTIQGGMYETWLDK